MILKSILSDKTFDFADYTSPHINLTPYQLAYDAMWELSLTGRWMEFKKAMCGCRSRGGYNCRCSDRDNVIAV